MSKLLDSLGGKEVLVVTNAIQRLFDGQNQIESSVHHKGILLDEDTDYVYLGYDFNNISALIAKNTVVSIVDVEIMDEMEALKEIMSQDPIDPDKLN